MKLSLKAGTTSKSVAIFIQNSSSTTGAGLTGLVYNSSSLVAYYVQPGSSAAAITLATLAAANSAWSSGGFKEVDATNMPGVYRLDIPDAVLTGATSVVIMLKGATNMAPCVLEIELTAWNNQDTVRGGLTALPNAAAEASGGLYTRGTGAGQINQAANGMIDGNLVRIANSAVSTSSAQLGVNVVQAGATAWGSGAITAASIAASALNGKGDWNIGKTGYTVSTVSDKTGYSLASGGLAAVTAWTVAITGDITGNLSGSVGSVTGAVGSVTGNVGGNVAGSVASVTGAVGSVTGLTASNLDATISSRLASASYTAPDNAGIGAIQAVTDLLPDAGALTSIATAASVATVDSNVDAIKAKTDSLTFTVAGNLDSNIQYVNDVQVTGDGQTGTEWGPA